MKARHWSLALILILINYLIFATLFSRLMESDFTPDYATRTPIPTFTPAPAEPFIVIPTLTPVPIIPTPTATRVIAPDGVSDNDLLQPDGVKSNASKADQAHLTSPGAVNIRSGPGTAYDVIGTLNANTSRPIIGRIIDNSWWQIKLADERLGWVSNTVVNVNRATATSVPIIEADVKSAPLAPVAQPAASNPPPEPEKPKHQFSPTGWYDDGNQGLTRFLGDIKDANGDPVNGAFVRASCGHYSTISFPSGPVGWGTLNESADWPAGFYDITVDLHPVPCVWVLSVVDTENRETVKAVLSEEIPVEVTVEKSVIVAGWRKNW